VTSIKVFLLSILCICTCYAQAQIPNRFLLFDVKAGLSQNSVTCFFEDSKGQVWIGTQDGLNVFDGKSFKHYLSDQNDSNSLSNKYILRITEDKLGNIWVGTAYGLNKLDPRSGKIKRLFVNKAVEEKGSTSAYNSFIANENGDLLINHLNTLYRYAARTDSVSIISKYTSLQLLESSNQANRYIICNDTLIDFRSNTIVYDLQKAKELCGLRAFTANNKYIVFCHSSNVGKIYLFDIVHKTMLDAIQMPHKVFDIHIDNKNKLYVATNKGLFVYSTNQLQQAIAYDAANPQSIPSGVMLSAFFDSRQTLWLGSASAGFACQPSAFADIKMVPSTSKNNAIQDISQYRDKVYLACNTGAYEVVQGKMKSIRQFSSNRVNAILRKDQLVYVAVEQDGLYILSLTGAVLKHITNTNSVLESNQIFALKTLREGIGICTEKYFYLMQNGTMRKTIADKSDGYYSYVLNATEDPAGNIYLATNSGVVIIDAAGHTKQLMPSIADKDVFGKTIITSVLVSQDSLLVSTMSNGVFILVNGKTVQHYYRGHGLQSSVVYSLARTADGVLWACTNSGIACLTTGKKTFMPIGVAQGLPVSYYSFGSMQAFNNTLYVGTDNGLFNFSYSDLHNVRLSIKPHIEQIVIDGTAIKLADSLSLIDAYNKNTIITFGNACIFDDLIFAYQLNDHTWQILPANQKSINFSNLPTGKNVLRVKAATHVEALLEAEAFTYYLNVKTPWYLNPWVIALCLISLIGLLFYAIKTYYKIINERKIQAYKTELQLQQERERISRDLHDNLGTYATALLAKIQRLQGETNPKDIAEMNELGNSIIHNIRETIWIMQTKQISVQDFSDKIKMYLLKLGPIYPDLKMSVVDDISDNTILTPSTTTHLFRIVQEAIHNCLKHAQAKDLSVFIKCTDTLHIEIADNGIGYSAVDAKEHYGIKNMQARAAEIGFAFAVQNTGLGTKILVTSKA
jgi:signal transduction histidine kinase/ligand-binding sensor domain-containing protein